ncbi:hypothetical protein CEXT_195481 [Caerostris extrusa]|uniref:Uncharacterized protein n=1 Tax=Caerostris extrusa TaxID=172846 RepID=A0AAV4R926_CAEEX|nr:hypothetical protein CEXT_195481 [Caerostris extrusa]
MTFRMSCAGPLGVNQCPEGQSSGRKFRPDRRPTSVHVRWRLICKWPNSKREEVLQLYLTPTSPVDVAAPGKSLRLAGKTGKREFIPKRLKENLPSKTLLPTKCGKQFSVFTKRTPGWSFIMGEPSFDASELNSVQWPVVGPSTMFLETFRTILSSALYQWGAF